MEFGTPFDQGVASQNADNSYTGKHRVFGTNRGIGFIPLGDRSRDKPEYGVDYVTERDSVDKYTKLHGS